MSIDYADTLKCIITYQELVFMSIELKPVRQQFKYKLYDIITTKRNTFNRQYQ